MYMCDLFASISFGMCHAVVVFAGVQSLRYNYNIRHEDFRQFVINTYYDDFANYTLSQLLEEIKYTLDDEMLDEFVKQIKGD